jgi:Fic family protein
LSGVRGGRRQPGEFHRAQNWIGAPDSPIEQAQFVPPPPDDMDRALDQLERFLHDQTPMPDLIKVGLAHAQFETIHPFLDGNGRVGRLLMTFLLCEWKILERPLLYLSHYLRQHRAEYYERLQAIRDEGAWESWLMFFLRGVELVATEAAAKAREIVAFREGLRLVTTERFGRRAPKALELVEKLYFQPFVTVHDVRGLIDVSFAYANQLVAALEANDVLVETSGRRRNRVFAFAAYLSMLEA